MERTEEHRRRLGRLTVEGITTLEACRQRRRELQELKRQILQRLRQVRTDVQRQAASAHGPKPTARELWERRGEGAKKLLRDVRTRVIGLVDRAAEGAVEEWGEINREIDRRLERLAALESQLVPASPAAAFDSAVADDSPDDAIYAAAGEAVRRGDDPGEGCPHCGGAVDADDRFCRRCGRRLGPDDLR